jgi:hypothetical protein
MTLADMIIVFVTALIVGLIIFNMMRHKGQNICDKCAYAKNCSDDCFPNKKTISK